MTVDPYVYPGTDTLRNHRNIRDEDALAVVEANVTAMSIAHIQRNPVPGNYDLEHLQDVHRAIFSDLYPWAGEVRTVAIAKTQLYALPQHIETFADDVFRKLHNDNLLRDLPRDEFVDKCTDYYADVYSVHPFSEGNTRSSRTFFRQLANEAGYDIRWQDVNYEQGREANFAAVAGNNDQLHEVFDQLVVKNERGEQSVSSMLNDLKRHREVERTEERDDDRGY